MGYCQRCGGITTGPRCKCGGSSIDAATSTIFSAEAPRDKWSKRYTRPSVVGITDTSTSSNPPLAPAAVAPASLNRTSSSTPTPTSSSNLAVTPQGSLPQANSGELNVFGSVLSPKDRVHCFSCSAPFPQGAVLYPHPDDKDLPSLDARYLCRGCFAVQFPKGVCKKCQLVILATQSFVNSDGDIWHRTCFVCIYCPSTSEPVIDLDGNPACGTCFATSAARGAPPPSGRGQPQAFKIPVSSTTSSFPRAKLVRGTKGTSAASTASSMPTERQLVGLGVDAAPPSSSTSAPRLAVQARVPRFKEDRDRSPIAPSLDELGEKLRKAGFVDAPRSASPTKLSFCPDPSTSAPSPAPSRRPLPTPPAQPPTSSRPASPSKPVAGRVSSWTSTHGRSTSVPAVPIFSRTSTEPTARLAFGASQPTASASPSRSHHAPVKQASLPSVLPDPASEAFNADAPCRVCEQPLGYGDFIKEPSTGRILHVGCFRCGGCEKELGAGKHVVVDERCWHKDCAPAPPRTYSFDPSLAKDSSPAAADPATLVTTTPTPTVDSFTNTSLPVAESHCSACHLPLGYGQNVTVPKTGSSFHEACLRCSKCEGRLNERGLVEVAGSIYHEKCAPPPASPSPRIRNSPFFAQAQADLSASAPRPVRPISLPGIGVASSLPPRHVPPPPLSPSSRPAPSIFATRAGRPSAAYGGLLVCPGCGTRATESETTQGPRGRRWHPKCLVCGGCGKQLDSEGRYGDGDKLKCEACRSNAGRAAFGSLPNSRTPSPVKVGTTRRA
ncbi:hypothetical protein JCM8097_004251 [Rhodosporidiobolus ruineniae]